MNRLTKRRRTLVVLSLVMIGLVGAACEPAPTEPGENETVTEGPGHVTDPAAAPYGYQAAVQQGADSFWEGSLTETLYQAAAPAPTGGFTAASTASNPDTLVKGAVVGTRTMPFHQAGTADGQGDFTGDTSTERVALACGQGQICGWTAPSGCKTVKVHIRQRSITNGVIGGDIYNWHYDKSWCWIAPRVGGPSARAYTSQVDWAWNWEGKINRAWYYYDDYRGHRGYRQDKFSLCVWLACAYKYPWAQVRSHGTGSYSWGGGNG